MVQKIEAGVASHFRVSSILIAKSYIAPSGGDILKLDAGEKFNIGEWDGGWFKQGSQWELHGFAESHEVSGPLVLSRPAPFNVNEVGKEYLKFWSLFSAMGGMICIVALLLLLPSLYEIYMKAGPGSFGFDSGESGIAIFATGWFVVGVTFMFFAKMKSNHVLQFVKSHMKTRELKFNTVEA